MVEEVVVESSMLVGSLLHSLGLDIKVHMEVVGVEEVEGVEEVVVEVVVVVVVVVEEEEEVVVVVEVVVGVEVVHMVVYMVVELVGPFANIGRGWHSNQTNSQVHTCHGTYLHTFVGSSEVLVVGMVESL